VKTGQQVSETERARRVDRPEADRARGQLRELVDRLTNRPRGAQRRARVRQRGGAHGSRRHLAAGAVQQLLAKLMLEPADLRRDGRLGDADASRGAGEAALLGDCDEVFELAQLHNESL
jgi:hypothetical protein